MPLPNQIAARNVHIFHNEDRSMELAGFFIAQPLTNSFVYKMLDIVIILTTLPTLDTADTEFFSLLSECGERLGRNDDIFRAGRYYLDSKCTISLTDEVPLTRMLSLQTGTRVKAFTDSVRSRDDHCIISGREVPTYEGRSFYNGFAAAHIFPLAYEGIWRDGNYSRWITEIPEKGGSINSVQNGLLLDGGIHYLFDSYDLTIDPKIICLNPSAMRFGGRALAPHFLDNPLRPPNTLLRWHFRQAVLTKMKGAGEPSFEHDFPPGSDILGDIRNGPKAAERMEFELFGRLAAQMEIFPTSEHAEAL